jgi:hypothetical protein
MMNSVPHDFVIGEVYLPPVLVAATLGLLAAMATAFLLNRFRLSNHFFYPPLVFLSLVVIYTFLIGFLLVPF